MPVSTASRASSIRDRPPTRRTRRRRRRCRNISARRSPRLRADACFRAGFGSGFVDYYAHIKEAELERFRKEQGEQPDVTAWEQNEYLDLF